MWNRRPFLMLLVSICLLAGCGSPECAPSAGEGPEVAAALPPGEPAYAIASAQRIGDARPKDWDDLHNVFQLSDTIVSGSEPHGEEALRRIAETWGVKTILSVDGKAPDVETAARHGMTYVHVPIQYSGITTVERLRIAKVFREMEGPFFVHCYHGKHRGPAAAALGRVLLDGATREQAIAEMLRCGTSSRYEGLYETIARAQLPSAQDSATYDWDFPNAHAFGGLRAAMIEVARVSDALKVLAARQWAEDPAHPDLDAGNEAAKLLDIFEKTAALEETRGRPDDYRSWLRESVAHAQALRESLADEPRRVEDAREAFDAVRARCSACHEAHRNPGE